MNSLEIQSLYFVFKNTNVEIFSDLNLKFQPGFNVMIEGDNGSGKSTLGKLICGLFAPTSGSIRICDKLIVNLRPNLRIQFAYYITQINQLQFISNSLKGEIAFAEKVAQKKFNIGEYSFFSLPSDLDYNPFELDVNQAWRLSLLIADVVNPFVLFIDEIPSGSNSLNKKALTFILQKRKKNNQITFVAYQRRIKAEFDLSFNLDEFHNSTV